MISKENPYKLICVIQDSQGYKTEKIVGYFKTISDARDHCTKEVVKEKLQTHKYFVGRGEIIIENNSTDGVIYWHTSDSDELIKKDKHYITKGYFYCMRFMDVL